MVPEDGQLIHFEGFPKGLLPLMEQGSSLLEPDEHEVLPVGEGQALPGCGHLGGGGPQLLVGRDLAALQDLEEASPGSPHVQVHDLAWQHALGLEKSIALLRQLVDEATDLPLGLQGSAQGALGLALDGLPQLAQGLEAEAEPGGHQAGAFMKGARSMPKI